MDTTNTEPRIPLAPVAGWEIGPIPAANAVMIRLGYVTHPLQTAAEAQQSPRFALAAQQCRELIAALQTALDRLDGGEQEGSGLPRH